MTKMNTINLSAVNDECHVNIPMLLLDFNKEERIRLFSFSAGDHV